MDNLERSFGEFNVSPADKLDKVLIKVYAIEAATSTILTNQARILAILENKNLEETLNEVNDDYQMHLKNATKDYTNWLSDFLE
jgi:hypothetical protein